MGDTKNIFIIEDDVHIHRLYRTVFKNYGYATHISRDGSNLIETIEEHNPDILLLDILLPGKDGIVLLRELKTHTSWSYLPVLVVSNYDKIDRIEEAKQIGIIDYMIKTNHSLSEIATRVRQYLSTQS
jgi:DNA-binding response OmpR family regulator